MTRMRALLLLIPLLWASLAFGTVITGTISNWQESGPTLQIGDATSFVHIWWSCAFCNAGGSAYFYGSRFSNVLDSDVAVATGVTDINQLTNASLYSFTNMSVGPVPVGTFVLYRNKISGDYAAIRIDDITGSGTYNTYLDGTWWLQTDGSTNLASIPEPSTCVLIATGAAALLGGVRRRWQGNA